MRDIRINISVTSDDGRTQTKSFDSRAAFDAWMEAYIKAEPAAIAAAPQPAPWAQHANQEATPMKRKGVQRGD
jgi:hypothetical protein